MAAHVGLDPRKDIHWITSVSPKPIELFAAGKIDAFLGFPPEPQDLRARGIGRVIVNSTTDRPWSQYFCCMLAAHQDYCSSASGCNKARVAGNHESHRPLRQRADAGCAAYRRWRLYCALRLRSADP
jgi:NitT/TauT family transport system substrate-binding protein